MQDKRRKKRQALNRPIIAICNDLYAPVLRPLRNVAAILSFAKPRVRTLPTVAIVPYHNPVQCRKQSF